MTEQNKGSEHLDHHCDVLSPNQHQAPVPWGRLLSRLWAPLLSKYQVSSVSFPEMLLSVGAGTQGWEGRFCL